MKLEQSKKQPLLDWSEASTMKTKTTNVRTHMKGFPSRKLRKTKKGLQGLGIFKNGWRKKVDVNDVISEKIKEK